MPRVLIADDNSNIQKMVSLALKDAGIEVVAVNNGEAAVRKMPEFVPDLVLADIFMPVRSGYEVCEFVKRDPRFMHTPVILLAGAFDPFDEREAQRVQADGVLKKPFVPPDPLVNMVTALLTKAAGERLVPVGVASHAAQAEVASHSTPVCEAPVEEFMDAPPEELKLPSAGPIFADDTTLAFGSLLESAPVAPADADFVVTAARDPVLGDPSFWAPGPTEEPLPIEELTQGHAWEEPVAASAQMSHVQPPDADLSPEIPEIEHLAVQLTEPEPEAFVAASHGSPVLEWPVHEKGVPEETPTDSPVVEQPGAVEPLTDWAAFETGETTALEQEVTHENSAYAAEDLAATAEAEDLPAAGFASASDVAPSTQIEAVEVEAAQSEAMESETVNSNFEPSPSVPQPLEFEQTEVMPSPDFSSIFALARTDLIPAVEAEIEQAAAFASVAHHTQDVPELADIPAHESVSSGLDLAQPETKEPPSPELIEAVVARVIERMQPKMIEIVTREILRPVVEALVRREIDKK